jgi:hypothetical protein
VVAAVMAAVTTSRLLVVRFSRFTAGVVPFSVGSWFGAGAGVDSSA